MTFCTCCGFMDRGTVPGTVPAYAKTRRGSACLDNVTEGAGGAHSR